MQISKNLLINSFYENSYKGWIIANSSCVTDTLIWKFEILVKIWNQKSDTKKL